MVERPDLSLRQQFRKHLPKAYLPADKVRLCRDALGHLLSRYGDTRPAPARRDARRPPLMDDKRRLTITLARLQFAPPGHIPAEFAAHLPTLCRAAVTYLRHEWTDYDHRMNRSAGDVEAQLDILADVLDGIARAFPWLRAECQKQLNEREDFYEDGWQQA
jgi:hypothetical protein